MSVDRTDLARAVLYELLGPLVNANNHAQAKPSLSAEALPTCSGPNGCTFRPTCRQAPPVQPEAGRPDRRIEADILEAVRGGKHLTMRQLAAAAGYAMGGHFRSAVACLRKRGRLLHDDSGYWSPT